MRQHSFFFFVVLFNEDSSDEYNEINGEEKFGFHLFKLLPIEMPSSMYTSAHSRLYQNKREKLCYVLLKRFEKKEQKKNPMLDALE